MSKQDNELTSQAGVHAVGLIVTRDLGWIFREQPVSDYGIDAHIEIVSTGASGRLLGLQIKAGASYFEEKTEDGFVYRGDQQHLDYWTNHSLPTVVVLCDLDGNCYWQNVTEEHVQRTESAWKMIIPKDQVLSADSADRLLELAQGSPFAQGLRELFLHKPWMDYIARGQVVALEAEKWVNKSLNRTTPTIVVVDNDGIESTGHQWPTMYIPGLGFIDSLKVLFQWADFSVDADFYEAYEGDDEAEWPGSDEPIPPYAENDEVEYYRFRLTLNELGKAFLTLEGYLRDFEMPYTFTAADVMRRP